jgi:rSAM/selenodomain-associated transferase 1
LIVFTRYPEPGKTKTRLIPALGAVGAAELQRKMTERALDLARQLQRERPVSVEICFEGGDTLSMQRWLGEDLSYSRQSQGDLGLRMHRAFWRTFEAGTKRAVLVGTDCPGLTAGNLSRAFDVLLGYDLVLGPAKDGGYYLIGLSRSIPQLFDGIPWGTAEVLGLTLNVAEEHGLSVGFVDTLDDVDRIEDLPLVEHLVWTG